MIMSPIFQFGAAGFAAVLLALMVIGVKWGVAKLLEAQERTLSSSQQMTAVVERNTETIRTLLDKERKDSELLRSLHDKLISRPCIAKGEH
jgi:deoxyinosine 3'endonuclease (endonuclease V)